MRTNALSVTVLVGLAAGFAGMSGCGHKEGAGEANKPLVVRVTEPTVAKITEYAYFTGRTDAVESVEMRARVTGYLDEILFKSGQEVKKDEMLFQIDPRPYKAEVDRDEGQVLVAKAKLNLAIADMARAREIARTPGAVSQQDLDKYFAAQSEADAYLKAAIANKEGAELNLKFTKVISPINGVVSRNLLTKGNLVTADNTLLTTIVALDPMYGYFDVDERTLLRIQKMIREGKMKSARRGDKIEVDLGLANEEGEYPYKGSIDFVNPQIDSSTGTLQVRGVFDNPKPADDSPRLLTPGLFVRIRVPLGEARESLLVPQAAIGTDQNKKYLLVVNKDKIVEYRPVQLGPEPEKYRGMQVIEPLSIVHSEKGVRLAGPGEQGEPSLKAGDLIIVGGLQRARPGAKVEIRMEKERQ
ncbi:MAG: efflux RND transporter periplasmic adaptor subunit [Planctomycetes bacterium]|nr:efflux RND transporter periplasmic adaptor subunit [Planctomycetota bacterium]